MSDLNGVEHIAVNDRYELRQVPEGNSPFRDAAEFITFSEVIEVVRPWWWLIGGAAALGLALAAAWVLNEVPQYRATAVLRVGESREAVTTGIEAPARELSRFINPLTSQVQLLRSRSLIAEVVDSVGFRLRPEYSGFDRRLLAATYVAADATADSLWLIFEPAGYSVRTQRLERWGVYGRPVELDGVRFVIDGRPASDRATWLVISRERAVDALLSSLRVSARSETNIVDVSFDHPDPVTAQRVVNTLVTRFQAFDAKFAQELAGRRRIFLEEQVQQNSESLARAEVVLTEFRTGAQTYDARQELAAQQQNRVLLDIRRGELDADRRMFQGLLRQLTQATGEDRWEALRTLVSSPGIAQNPVVSQIHQQLLRYRIELDSLTTGAFGSAGTNPDVQRQRELIAGAEQELINAIRSHVASLDARSQALDDLAYRTASQMELLPPQLAEEARLAQLVETYRKIGDQLREEYQKARMAEAVAVGQADILDLATLPYKPLSAMRALKLALGLLAGLALGGGGAFLLEHRNRSIRRREEVETLFQIPLLGVIPRAAAPALLEAELLTPDSTGNGDGSAAMEADGEEHPPVLAQDATHISEAYRMLRTNFMCAPGAHNVKTLLITSTAPREGKTLTATHLAASIAEEGLRVLLIDADLWRGRVHEIAGIPEAPGLVEILAGEAAPSAVPTGIPGLYLLPRGRRHPSPSSLTRSTEVRKILQDLGKGFDMIVVDAPPVLATAAGPALAAVADGVVLVIRAGRTDRAAVREALRQLRMVEARILGAVLNDPSGWTFIGERPYYYAYAKP